MYIVAIGWIYVVFMMSITEVSIIAGIMTFLMYGVLPLIIIIYIGGARQRKLNRTAAENMRKNSTVRAESPLVDGQSKNPKAPDELNSNDKPKI